MRKYINFIVEILFVIEPLAIQLLLYFTTRFILKKYPKNKIYTACLIVTTVLLAIEKNIYLDSQNPAEMDAMDAFDGIVITIIWLPSYIGILISCIVRNIMSNKAGKEDIMAIDRADWHWKSAEEVYREAHGITGELTEEQEDEIWNLSAEHIGIFLEWIIENHMEGVDADEEDCEKVRNGEMSGTEYLFRNCDGKLCDVDINENLMPFVEFYYNDYCEDCVNINHSLLKKKIDERYESYKRRYGGVI